MQREICQGKNNIKRSARSFLPDLLETQTYHHRLWQSKQTLSGAKKLLACVNWQPVLLLIQQNFLSCLACLLGVMKHKSSCLFSKKKKRAYLVIGTTYKGKKAGTQPSLATLTAQDLGRWEQRFHSPGFPMKLTCRCLPREITALLLLTCHCLAGDRSFLAPLDLDQIPRVSNHLEINGRSG